MTDDPEPSGDPARPADPAGAALLPFVYDELRRLAAAYLAGERSNHTLQATALVNEAWLRIGERSAVDREHFLALAAQAMRRVLIDHARTRDRDKRGGGAWQRVTLAEPVTPGGTTEVDILEIHEVLERLAARDARAARVVELRFFGGLSIDETARVLGVSSGTVDNDWFAAKAWLGRELRGRGDP